MDPPNNSATSTPSPLAPRHPEVEGRHHGRGHPRPQHGRARGILGWQKGELEIFRSVRAPFLSIDPKRLLSIIFNSNPISEHQPISEYTTPGDLRAPNQGLLRPIWADFCGLFGRRFWGWGGGEEEPTRRPVRAWAPPAGAPSFG